MVYIILIILPVVGIVYQLLASYLQNGLNRYPGPWLAKFTKLWHRLDAKSNQHQHHLLELHRQHGDVVRIGPNTLSIANPDFIPKIFGVKNEFLKSEMYDPFAPRINGKPVDSWLSVREPKAHATIKRPIASAYSLTMLTEYESLVDDMIKKFMDRLEDVSRCQEDMECDMAVWLRLYAFDVIMHLTFSDTLGFLDAGGDVNDFMVSLDRNLDRTSLLVTIPWTAYLVKHNPFVGFLVKDHAIFPAWAGKQIQKRMNVRKETQSLDPGSEYEPKDFLDRFLDAGLTEGPPVAGADTTAIGLRAILYYLLKTPQKKQKLLRELRGARLSYPVSWKESQQLPYLDACIKEAFRLHPAIGFGLERKVPTLGSLVLGDYALPAGTNVSLNAWVLNRQAIYGDNTDDFIPERWLQGDEEGNEEYKERIAKMNRADLTFGAGSRSCTGKYISLLEIFKAIPTLLLNFDVKLVDETQEWTTINRWAVRQENIRCTLLRKPQ